MFSRITSIDTLAVCSAAPTRWKQLNHLYNEEIKIKITVLFKDDRDFGMFLIPSLLLLTVHQILCSKNYI
jgi:hypothetical protein